MGDLFESFQRKKEYLICIDSDAVSYTHLDVYKRQGMGLPNMKKYSDVLEVDTTLGVGTTVRMVVKIV